MKNKKRRNEASGIVAPPGERGCVRVVRGRKEERKGYTRKEAGGNGMRNSRWLRLDVFIRATRLSCTPWDIYLSRLEPSEAAVPR